MIKTIIVSLILTTCISAFTQNKTVVFQTDFGLKDGAVSAMKGVAMGVSYDLKLYDITHEIPAYNIWEAAYRLQQTVTYWPVGTVFVSVCDPGVGTSRQSVVALTNSGHYIVTPNNGTLTLIAQSLGIKELHQINEVTNRRKNSEKSYTFHGRDVYAYTAAKLAAGLISLNEVGNNLPLTDVVKLPYQAATLTGSTIQGTITILDVQYGNLWTNISDSLFAQLNPTLYDKFTITITQPGKQLYKGIMPYTATFGAVAQGKPLLYLNSLMHVAIALNMGSFANVYKVVAGNNCRISISKL